MYGGLTSYQFNMFTFFGWIILRYISKYIIVYICIQESILTRFNTYVSYFMFILEFRFIQFYKYVCPQNGPKYVFQSVFNTIVSRGLLNNWRNVLIPSDMLCCDVLVSYRYVIGKVVCRVVKIGAAFSTQCCFLICQCHVCIYPQFTALNMVLCIKTS